MVHKYHQTTNTERRVYEWYKEKGRLYNHEFSSPVGYVVNYHEESNGNIRRLKDREDPPTGYMVVAIDQFLSGWGGASYENEPGLSVVVWVCLGKYQLQATLEYVRNRKEMKRIKHREIPYSNRLEHEPRDQPLVGILNHYAKQELLPVMHISYYDGKRPF